MLRTSLVAQALERLDEQAVSAALALIAQQTGDTARDAVEDAAAISDVTDIELVHAAAGALAQAANGVVNFLSTFVAFALLDRVGRRTLLICGGIGMATSMAVLAILGTVYSKVAHTISNSCQVCSCINVTTIRLLNYCC